MADSQMAPRPIKEQGHAPEEKAFYKVINYKSLELPDSYRNMILARFLRSLRFGNDYFKLIDQSAFYSTYNKYLNHLLQKKDTQVLLAVLEDNEDVCLGWSMTENKTLHYVHVQRDYRKNKIHTFLIPPDISCFSHITKRGAQIWAKDYPHLIFNPF